MTRSSTEGTVRSSQSGPADLWTVANGSRGTCDAPMDVPQRTHAEQGFLPTAQGKPSTAGARRGVRRVNLWRDGKNGKRDQVRLSQHPETRSGNLRTTFATPTAGSTVSFLNTHPLSLETLQSHQSPTPGWIQWLTA